MIKGFIFFVLSFRFYSFRSQAFHTENAAAKVRVSRTSRGTLIANKNTQIIDMLLIYLADLIFIRERDYITNPKPNGYRSHHIILGVNVFCLDASEYYPVEIQLRTISMDFWAAMEHRISYKKEYDNREQRVAELLSYADTLVDMEKEFEKYNENATLS